MKTFLIIGAAALAMTACSSKDKGHDMASKDAMAKKAEMESSAKATMDKTMEKGKESMDSMKKDMGEAGKSMAGDMSTSCTLGKDTRVIEVRKTASGGCELFYNKFNEEKSVASSGYGTQYCEEVKDRIQGNLAKAGFNCQ